MLRCLQWRIFLNANDLHASHRASFLTLTGGDAAQILPAGLYFQDLLVSRELHSGVSEPLAATTLMIWLEVTVAMLGLALLGLPGLPLLRPLMAACGIGSLVVLCCAHTRLLGLVLGLLSRVEHRLGQQGRQVVAGVERFLHSFRGLSHPRVLLSGLALRVAYMTLTILGFYLVCAGLHLPGIGVPQAAAIYSLVLAVVNANPLPSDLGGASLRALEGFWPFMWPQPQVWRRC
jgi:hypothetical protein